MDGMTNDAVASTERASSIRPVRSRPRRAEEVPGFAGEAFGALLDSTRRTVRAQTLSEVRSSPAQMFEPLEADEELPSGTTQAEPTASRVESKDGELQLQPAKSTSNVNSIRKGTALDGAAGGANVPSSRSAPVPGASHESSAGAQVTKDSNATPKAAASGDRASGMSAPSPVLITATPPASRQTPAAPLAVPTSTSPAEANNPAKQLGEILSAPRTTGLTASTAPARSSPDAPSKGTTAAKAKETPGKPNSAAPEDAESVSSFERLVRSMRLHIGPRTSTARLQLHPPQLGRMRVDVRVEGDRVEVDVRTENQTARDLVAQRAGELKTALEQHGLEVRRFDVVVRPPVPLDDDRSRPQKGDRVADRRRNARPTRSSGKAPLDVRV